MWPQPRFSNFHRTESPLNEWKKRRHPKSYSENRHNTKHAQPRHISSAPVYRTANHSVTRSPNSSFKSVPIESKDNKLVVKQNVLHNEQLPVERQDPLRDLSSQDFYLNNKENLSFLCNMKHSAGGTKEITPMFGREYMEKYFARSNESSIEHDDHGCASVEKEPDYLLDFTKYGDSDNRITASSSITCPQFLTDFKSTNNFKSPSSKFNSGSSSSTESFKMGSPIFLQSFPEFQEKEEHSANNDNSSWHSVKPTKNACNGILHYHKSHELRKFRGFSPSSIHEIEGTIHNSDDDVNVVSPANFTFKPFHGNQTFTSNNDHFDFQMPQLREQYSLDDYRFNSVEKEYNSSFHFKESPTVAKIALSPNMIHSKVNRKIKDLSYVNDYKL